MLAIFQSLTGKLAALVARSDTSDWSARIAARLLQVVDWSLLGIIFVAPYFMGGRHPVGRLVFVTLAMLMATAWSMRQCLVAEGRWHQSWAQVLLLLAILLDVAQVVPWPQQFLATVSPHTAQILPAIEPASAASAATAWSCISMTPEETRSGLAMLLAQGFIFLVTLQRVREIGDVERILRWLAGGVTLMAAIGLLQYLAGNGKFLWVYDHPYRDTTDVVKGSFINRNHFAHFLALGLGPLAWWIATELRRRTKAANAAFGSRSNTDQPQTFGVAALVLALAVVLFAGLSTLSRGGALAMAVAITVSTLAMYRSSTISWRYLISLLGIVLLLGMALYVHGYSRVALRLDDLTAGSINRLDAEGGRRRIWAANWSAFQDHHFLGTGLGSQREVYPMYLKDWLPVEFTHAESGYFQVASEMGGVGLALLACAMLLVGYWCLRVILGHAERRHVACMAALAGSLAASLIHSLVDFVWYIPACLALTAIIAACALRIFQLSRPAPSGGMLVPRLAWYGVAMIAVVSGGWMVANQLGPARAASQWDSYLRDSDLLGELANSDDDSRDDFADITEAKGNAGRSQKSTQDSADQICRSMLDHLTYVLRVSPNDARAHMRMAGTCLMRFGQLQQNSANAMSLSQVCDAALSSHFQDRQQLDRWLQKALGPNIEYLERALWHTRRALSLCPLQGEGYVYLAQLCFLEGGDRAAKAAYVAQALRVRPHDDSVLFEAGKETMLLGDMDSAIELWKKSFHQGGGFKFQLVQLLAGRVPVGLFLEKFEPTLDDWPVVQSAYRRLQRVDDLQQLCTYFVRLAQQNGDGLSPQQGVLLWLNMSRMYADLNDPPRALECCRQAYRLGPDDWKTRYAMALILFATQQFDEAEEHLHWCLQRQPDNAAMQSRWRRLVALKVAASNSNTAALMKPSSVRR